jgi:hypothetical protein
MRAEREKILRMTKRGDVLSANPRGLSRPSRSIGRLWMRERFRLAMATGDSSPRVVRRRREKTKGSSNAVDSR